jgi:hypothetical protein
MHRTFERVELKLERLLERFAKLDDELQKFNAEYTERQRH